jgi:hypothetical protein
VSVREYIMKREAFVLAVATVLSGCASTRTMSGDLGSFLKRELTDRGAHLSEVTAPAPIQAEWEFRPDKYGFVAVVQGDRFKEVDAWIRQAFGAPYFPCETHCFYNPRVIGVALQYLENPDKTVDIICLKRRSP